MSMVEISPPAAQRWAGEISAAWQSGVEGILHTGELLVAARKELRGQFQVMVDRDLPFGPRTARRLMAIARHPVLSDRTHVSALPPSWGTLYELTKLPGEELQARLSDGRIHADLERKQIKSAAVVSDVSPEARGLFHRLREFERVLDRPLGEVMVTMTPDMVADVHRLAPRVALWLAEIGRMEELP